MVRVAVRGPVRQRCLTQGQPRMQRLREFDGVALTADMHVEDRRGCAEQVIVNRRDLDAVVDQPFHHRADLILGQH